MSRTYDLMEYVKTLLVGKIPVPADKIFLARPSTIFAGEGVVVLVYPLDGTRSAYGGSLQWHDSSRLEEGIAVDVMVDDIYNMATNSTAIKTMCEIRASIELSLFSGRDIILGDLADKGFEMLAYAPGASTTYEIQTEKSVLIGTRTELKVEYVENWQRVARDTTIADFTATIETIATERELYGEL